MLDVSDVAVAVSPVNTQEIEYHDSYTLFSLLSGIKAWLVCPQNPGKLASLRAECQVIAEDVATSLKSTVFALDLRCILLEVHNLL